MKCSENWLHTWVKPQSSREVLADKLTMAGLEVESIAPVAEAFSKVIIVAIKAIKKHPNAEQLQIATVTIKDNKELNIVCGATNLRVGMKCPLAEVGASLPNGVQVKATTIRDVESAGMLCSGKELGLSEDNSGLLELPADAPLGADLWNYLQLDDVLIDLSITPNRGDWLSMRGITREISLLLQLPWQDLVIPTNKITSKAQLEVKVTASDACPHYQGRVIKNINPSAFSPVWLREKLRRAGVRSISPVVDVTNYVMLELGQPMHAFDLDKIQGHIEVRYARAGEKILLLDDSEHTLNDKTLIIADAKKPLAIAGVMGGKDSAVSENTKHVFLESALFNPQEVAKSRQAYQLNSESAYRFERSIDRDLQDKALERATELISSISAGEIGPISQAKNVAFYSEKPPIYLSSQKLQAVLGIKLTTEEVLQILKRLDFSATLSKDKQGFQIQPPSFRNDIAISEDIIEEIARIYGYDKIPMHPMTGTLSVSELAPLQLRLQHAKLILSGLAYHEIISYSFISAQLHQLLALPQPVYEVMNPISSEMAIMRSNLWPGLMQTYLYNKSRQQARIRLFEQGLCFIKTDEESALQQLPRLGGLIAGSAAPLQWGIADREVDFFDAKGDIEHLLKQALQIKNLQFVKANHPALHPGQTAAIMQAKTQIGLVGAVHPGVLKTLDIKNPVYLFEIDLNMIKINPTISAAEISKFPEIRRDLAILINETVPVQEIQATIMEIAGSWLKDIFIFDVYQGKGISSGLKSVALGLIFQHPDRTLVDDEVIALVERVVTALKGRFDANLRS